jgi:amicoumacin kinase
MEKTVEGLFTEEILCLAAEKFNVEPSTLEKIGDFENYIFKGKREDQEVIIRLTHSSHRLFEDIEAELDWVLFLKNNGLNVYEQYRSQNNQFIETFTAKDGSEFYVCCYEKIPGVRLGWKDIKNNHELVTAWGRTIGRLHKVTKNYEVPVGKSKRPNWDEEELLEIEKFKPDIPKEIVTYRNEVVHAITKMPKTKDQFGLIHSDLHFGNFHYFEGQLYLFDFDDCTYHWFASDIAMPVYYIILAGELAGEFEDTHQKEKFAAKFLSNFFKGYEQENSRESIQEKDIEWFLRLRDIVLLSVLYKKFDITNLSSQETKFLDSVYHRVINKELIVKLT